VKPGAVVIDCGINTLPDDSKKSGQKMVTNNVTEENLILVRRLAYIYVNLLCVDES
jgi:5,10-methylene-tetrahydrofolate dehydrogenase/methenyl tetrahydrofolate cyclohydrolase